MSYEIRVLGPGEGTVLNNVAPGVFDHPIHPEKAAEFLADPRHHIAVAVANGMVVGSASAVHYVHPDKAVPELWINEVAVSPDHQGRGLGKAILDSLFQHARELGCREAWTLTERDNTAAMRLYASRGGVESTDDVVMFSFRLDSM